MCVCVCVDNKRTAPARPSPNSGPLTYLSAGKPERLSWVCCNLFQTLSYKMRNMTIWYRKKKDDNDKFANLSCRNFSYNFDWNNIWLFFFKWQFVMATLLWRFDKHAGEKRCVACKFLHALGFLVWLCISHSLIFYIKLNLANMSRGKKITFWFYARPRHACSLHTCRRLVTIIGKYLTIFNHYAVGMLK